MRQDGQGKRKDSVKSGREGRAQAACKQGHAFGAKGETGADTAQAA